MAKTTCSVERAPKTSHSSKKFVYHCLDKSLTFINMCCCLHLPVNSCDKYIIFEIYLRLGYSTLLDPPGHGTYSTITQFPRPQSNVSRIKILLTRATHDSLRTRTRQNQNGEHLVESFREEDNILQGMLNF